MSTKEAKVNATYDFLANRASLGRTTNHEEVARVISDLLVERKERRSNKPTVRREKVQSALAEVDARSQAEKGVALSALVQKFWVDGVNSKFYGRNPDATDLEAEVERVFEAFPSYVDVRTEATNRARTARRTEEDPWAARSSLRDRLVKASQDAEEAVDLDRGGRHSNGLVREQVGGRRQRIEELSEQLIELAESLRDTLDQV